MDKILVEIAIIVITGFILVWDAYLYLDKKEGNTISQVIIAKTKEKPWIPLLWGILMGHWFF